ncbi:hypothetical protein C1Y63_10700 [Corynebacterium sp. 13CS0277]|uniref:hypothetical protein n=1 Tax=Corynebacterium sp. 13CS0277 TaxID=2071994 RepID=UPI000D04402C|nr:hypothetical protein [Corynebacterium sp. 13CS0277]PRQ10574.1 hypothetical protein C1Y63_10700 [Corynebacterium sp. 13CS0277]
MEPQASPVTIVVGRGHTAAGVRQVLEDFAALGIVRNLIWIDADSFHHADSLVRVARPGFGTRTIIESVSLTKALVDIEATNPGRGTASFILVNNIAEEAGRLGPDNIAPVTLALDSVGYSSRLHRTNLMLAPAHAQVTHPLPTLRGYVNLLLAPEDSAGPDQPAATLDGACPPQQLALHYAASIASICGAWTGSGDVPAHHMDTGQGDTFRLVRTYYRRIDGQRVQTLIKLGVFDTTVNPQAKLSRPGQAVYAHYPVDAYAFADACAQQLVGEYREVLTGARYQAITQSLVHTTAGHALADFGRAYGRNLVTAPARFLRRLRYDVATARDYAVQKHLYGVTGSRVQVGRVSLVGAQVDEADAVATAATQAPTREEIAAELEPLWRSYSNMALTMMDASPRAFGQVAGPRYPEACQEPGTSNIHVAPAAEYVIPGPSTRFGRLLPPQLKNLMGEPIAGYDVVGAAAYERQLAQLTGSQHRAIGRTIGDFRQWREKHSHSFAARIGLGLEQMRRDITAERARYEADIDRLSREEQPASTPDDSPTKWLRFFGWVAVSSLLLFLLLWGVGNIHTSAASGLPEWVWVRTLNDLPASGKASYFGSWFAFWLLVWMTQVALETRDDIKDANRRRTVRSDMNTARENAAACTVALDRIEVAYGQFVSVSHMLGAILEYPFGQVTKNEQRAVTPTNAMPRHVVLAEATPEEDTIRTTVERHRMGVYEEGWMGPLAGEALARAAATLRQEQNITVDVAHVLGQPGDHTGSALDRIADIAASPDFNHADRTGGHWLGIVSQLAHAASASDIADISIARVASRAAGAHTAPLRPLKDLEFAGTFNGQFLTEHGQTMSRIGTIDQAYYAKGSSTQDAIGGGEVLVQLSRPAVAADVQLDYRATPDAPTVDAADNPFASPDFFTQGDL